MDTTCYDLHKRGIHKLFPFEGNVFVNHWPKANADCVVEMGNGAIYGSPERQKSK